MDDLSKKIISFAKYHEEMCTMHSDFASDLNHCRKSVEDASEVSSSPKKQLRGKFTYGGRRRLRVVR